MRSTNQCDPPAHTYTRSQSTTYTVQQAKASKQHLVMIIMRVLSIQLSISATFCICVHTFYTTFRYDFMHTFIYSESRMPEIYRFSRLPKFGVLLARRNPYANSKQIYGKGTPCNCHNKGTERCSPLRSCTVWRPAPRRTLPPSTPLRTCPRGAPRCSKGSARWRP
jgi:hypothetical protein